MKKLLIILCALLTSLTPVYAEDKPYPSGNNLNVNGSVLGMEFDAGTGNYKWRPLAVDANGQLKTTGSVQVEEGGQTITVDLSTLHFDTTRIEELLKEDGQVKELLLAEYQLDENTPELFFHTGMEHSDNVTQRVFIDVRAGNTEDEFLVAFDKSGTHRPVKGRIMLNVAPTQMLGIASKDTSKPVKIYITEGWK